MEKSDIQTIYKRQLHDDILRSSMNEFMRKGIRAVKMDDIAKLLGISKRTLYEVYSNKEELLLEGVRMYEVLYDKHMREFENDPTNNVIDIIIEFYNIQIKWWSDVNQSFFVDIEKYRKVREYFEQKDKEHKDSRILFLRRGVKEGLFLPDVDYEILSQIGHVTMEHLRRSFMYKEYGVERILRDVILLFVRGICTKQGIEQLDALLNVRS